MLEKTHESEVEKLSSLEWGVLIPRVEEALDRIKHNNRQLGEDVKKLEKQIGFVKHLAREYSKTNPQFSGTPFSREIYDFLEKLEKKVMDVDRIKDEGEMASLLLLALLSKVKKEIHHRDIVKFKDERHDIIRPAQA
jgi:hypothetical protein